MALRLPFRRPRRRVGTQLAEQRAQDAQQVPPGPAVRALEVRALVGLDLGGLVYRIAGAHYPWGWGERLPGGRKDLPAAAAPLKDWSQPVSPIISTLHWTAK